MKISAVHFCIAAASLLLSTSSSAQQALSGEEITKLVSGNTVEMTFVLRGNSKNMIYHAPDGSAVLFSENGSETKGKWRVTSDGLHCSHWDKRSETCAQIIKESDGTFKRVENGTVRAEWQRVVPGKLF
ncbi:MAG: hypothetical protein AABY73_11260 [Pseudomonadota bacterium]